MQERVSHREVPTLFSTKRVLSLFDARDTKASVVERFSRTYKEHMYRNITARRTQAYVNVLPKFLSAYNRGQHRSIGMDPREAASDNEGAVWTRFYGKRLKGYPDLN